MEITQLLVVSLLNLLIAFYCYEPEIVPSKIKNLKKCPKLENLSVYIISNANISNLPPMFDDIHNPTVIDRTLRYNDMEEYIFFKRWMFTDVLQLH